MAFSLAINGVPIRKCSSRPGERGRGSAFIGAHRISIVAVSGIRHQEGRNLKKALTLTLTPLSKQVSESNCFFMCGEAFIDGGTMTLAGPTGRNGWRPSRI
jgi:hypothetical protein